MFPTVRAGFNPQFFPQLSGIQQLFKGPATVASIILHILSINLFLGRGIYFEGKQQHRKSRVLDYMLQISELGRTALCSAAKCWVLIQLGCNVIAKPTATLPADPPLEEY